MIGKNSGLYKKLEEMIGVYEYQKKIFKENMRLVPNLMLDISSITTYEEYALYEEIPKIMKPVTGSEELYIYKTTSEPALIQIRTLVYELSKRARNRAYYKGMLVVSLTIDFLKIEDYLLFIEFLAEQKWHIIFSAKSNANQLYNNISQMIYVTKPVIVEAKDMEFESPISLLMDNYEIVLGNEKAKSVVDYINTARESKDYDNANDRILLNTIAYNAVRMSMDCGNKRSIKVNDINDLIGDFDATKLEKNREIKMGFR